MSMILFYIVLDLIFLAGFSGSSTSSVVNPNINAECQSWQNVKNFIHQNITENVNCVVNSNCTGLGCSGKIKDYDFNVDVNIKPCDTPVTLDIILNIPKFSINNSKYILHDGQRFKLPHLINPSDVYVEASIKHEKNIIFISLILKQYLELTRNWIRLPLNHSINIPDCGNEKIIPRKIDLKTTKIVPATEPSLTTSTVMISKKPCSEKNDCRTFEICTLGQCTCPAGMVHNNSDENTCIQVSAPHQKTGRQCDISKILNPECLEGEICVQFNKALKTGECECKDDYHLDANKNCVKDKDSPSPEIRTSSVTLTLAIAIPILVLMVCGGLIFVVVKFHLIHRLRVYRRRVRSYEVVDIGNDDDDDEPLAT